MGSATRGAAVTACQSCHIAQARAATTDAHAKASIRGATPAPTCVSCHGSHDVLRRANPRSRTFPANVAAQCASCHDPALRAYMSGVHATIIQTQTGIPAATCTGCHNPHAVRPPNDAGSTVSAGRLSRTCGACHWQAATEYNASTHAALLRRAPEHAPTCVTCHGSHAMARTRADSGPASPARIANTCSSCHADVRLVTQHRLAPSVVTSFRESYHGLAVALRDRRAANCASCHGAHEVLPASDSRSRVHPANIPATCGSCHAGVTSGFARGGIHHAAAAVGHRWVDAVRSMYVLFILGLVGLMFAHNALDFIRRWRDRGRPAAVEAPPAGAAGTHRVFVRFSLNERVQHWVLAASFITLVITGFALKFGWTVPGISPQTGAAIRAWGHRVAAVVFMALSLYHLAYLAGTARGRKIVRDMLPRFEKRRDIFCCAASCMRLGPPSVSDWRDLAQMVRYNLGLTRERPRFGRFTYAEKMEYFALAWGSLVMVATGLVLWFEVPFLNRFPFWSFELATVVHLYEAILATAAIVVWHFYFTIFNPDVFPLSRTMVSGTVGEEEMRREHPRELEERDGP